MAHEVGDGGDVDVFVLQQDRKAESGTGPGDLFGDIGVFHPLFEYFVGAVIGRQVKYPAGVVLGQPFAALV